MSALQIFNNLHATHPAIKECRSFKIQVDTYNCCHIAIVKDGNDMIIHGSGTKKFKIVVELKPRSGNILVSPTYYYGTTQPETNIILAKILHNLNNPLPANIKPKWAKGIFIRRNRLNASNANFKIAQNSFYFHKPFITFCRKNNFYCHIR